MVCAWSKNAWVFLFYNFPSELRTHMHHYTIKIQNKGGHYRLGTVSDPEQQARLLEWVTTGRRLSLQNSVGDRPINYLDFWDILRCSGPYYAQAMVTVHEDGVDGPIDIYKIPDHPDCLLSSLETETPYLDLDKLEVECPQGLVFGGYATYGCMTHNLAFKTDQPFDRAALFFGVVNLADLFGDRLVVSHAYYLSRAHRVRLGQLAFPGENVTDAFIYEELENIYEQGRKGKQEILQVLDSSKVDLLETHMDELKSEHPYLYRVDGTILYPKS